MKKGSSGGIKTYQWFDSHRYNSFTAISSLISCCDYSGTIYSNTLSAFSSISQGEPPNPVTGEIINANSQMTAEQIAGTVTGTLQTWLDQQLLGSTPVYITGESSFVSIDNTSSLPAYFTVVVSYSHTITVQSDNAGIGSYSITLPTIASATALIGANQTGQVQIYYGDDTYGTLPDVQAPIAIYVLGGYTKSQEIYYVGQSSTTMQWPSIVGSSVILANPSGAKPVQKPDPANSVFETPIKSFVVENPDNQTYQTHILIQNPFAIPLQAVVTQPLPTGIAILSTAGFLSNASIVWTNILATNGLVDDTFSFTLPVLPGMQTNLPAPSLVFSDSTGTNSLTVQAATPVFSGLFPIQVGGTIPPGAFGVDALVQITITNLVAANENGSLTISVADLNGNAITNFPTMFSVNGETGTNLTFTLPGTLPVGQYFITGTLNMNGGTGQMFSSVYVVPEIPFALYAAAPGWPTTNGINLSLRGPIGSNYVVEASTDLTTWTPIIYFASTNSPTPFTDTTATNSSARFYRALMVPIATSQPQ